MIEKFTPTYYSQSVYTVNWQKLYDDGIRFLLFDIDNTLCTYDEDTPSKKLQLLNRKLTEIGFKSAIISNGHSERAKMIAETLEMDFEGDALKPAKKGYERLLSTYGMDVKQTAAIGDQLFTDIWGATRMGCTSVLVNPTELSNEPGFVKFKRIIERKMIKSILDNSEELK